ncbi:hypothetical protein [Azorhizobium caulinodans]|uniref:hypothetical protein n=1 Tax=Azorhizobium caulinodans TaxID=7 RepID=UPI002FBD832C
MRALPLPVRTPPGETGTAPASSAPPAFKTRIVLSQAAQSLVVQSGLSVRMTWLSERADELFSTLQQGDRVALSDSGRHDLVVLRRRLVADPAAPVIEVLLDLPSSRL